MPYDWTMDPNSTGRARPRPQPGAAPSEPAVGPTTGPSAQRPNRHSSPAAELRLIIAIPALAIVVMIVVVAVASGGILGTASASSTPESPGSASASVSATPSETAAASLAPSPSPTAVPTPSAAPTVPTLPGLLGAIGDSYSQAWGVSPAYPLDHTEFSWVVGTDKSQGVLSLLQRFQALGGAPTVVDAATSGKKMGDATRQANLVVAAAKKLGAGGTAYVTFELGTNDLCASPDAMTDPTAFGAQLQTAIVVLEAGLPAGSRVLMLPVPDFPHFRDITQADPTAKAALALPKNANRCAPYLGSSSAAMLAQGNDYLARYNASLKAACEGVNVHAATGVGIGCTYSPSRLSASDFTIDDLSSADYFHPSLSGQAKLAEDAWQADVWATTRLP